MKASRALWLAPSALLVGLGFAWALPERATPNPAVPRKHEENGYLSSSACRACHPSEYASWHQTFHRTMTRRVSDLKWGSEEAPQLPLTLDLYGRQFSLKRNADGRMTVRGPDLHAAGRALPALAKMDDASALWKRRKSEEIFRSVPDVEREIVLVTGSHNYLAFWVEGGAKEELRQLPFVFFLEAQRWTPREEAFLQPPDALPFVARWNANCIQCHAVAGRPEQSEGEDPSGFWQKYESRVAEFGISCEACHGPGSLHVRHYQNPLRRVAASREKGDAEPAAQLFNPRKSTAEVGSEACGQCHSYFLPSDPDSWWESGFSANYQAGQALSNSRRVVNAEDFEHKHSGVISALGAGRDSLFWDDGSMIVGGREFNGLIKSPCFEHGQGDAQMSCVSCHSMHDSDPNRQISVRFASPETEDKMCTQCHQGVDTKHSRHDPTGEGARCVSCHMPRTSYALLQGTRSHRVSSPQPEQTSPPSACVLCHVSESKAWVTAQLSNFSELGSPWPAPNSDASLPWAAELSLAHNAITRALMADALGRKATLEASGNALSLQLLPLLRQDEYAAVRLIAERSWEQLSASAPQKSAPLLSEKTLLEILSRQDASPIVISE